MASVLYLIGCGVLAGLALLELKTQNRLPHIETYLTLLGATVFCGLFALLVTFAGLDSGRYQAFAGGAVLLLTIVSLTAVTRMAHRLRQFRPR